MRGTLYFDGHCGICTRSRNFLVWIDRTGNLVTEPYQREGSRELLGVTPEQLPESAWWLDSSGAVWAGAEAINAAISAAVGTRLPLLFYRVPGVKQLQEWGYRWIADHRYRFRGVTPYCERHPSRC